MKNTETGRSMVEMLGVLAIIGVLSVAGIAGYTQAMMKTKINDILSAASQCAILARTYQGGGTVLSAKNCTDIGLTKLPKGASAMTVSHDADDDEVNLEITPDSSVDATKLANAGGSDWSVSGSGVSASFTFE